jgi:hypothetical protein
MDPALSSLFMHTSNRLQEYLAGGALRGPVAAIGDRTDLIWSTAVGVYRR